MEKNLELTKGHWLLVVGSQRIVPTLLTMTARLAEKGPVRVVDGWQQYNAFLVGYFVNERAEVLERIKVSQANSCHDMLSILESMSSEPQGIDASRGLHQTDESRGGLPHGEVPGRVYQRAARPEPFVVLDLLSVFFDPFVYIDERKRLLGECLSQLDRLAKGSSAPHGAETAKGGLKPPWLASGLVSVRLPYVLSQTESDLLNPDCARVDTMTRAEYHRWQASDWPVGARVWINGVRVR